MTHPKLTGTQSAVMFVLMAQAREVRNPDLVPTLDKPGRDKLNKLGLIESVKKNRSFVHTLTDDGWAWCAAELESEPPTPSTPQIKALYTVLSGVGRYLRAGDLRLYEVFGPPVDALSATPSPAAATAEPGPPGPTTPIEDRIRATYQTLAPRPGAWVTLTELRSALDDIARADLDTALVELQREPGVSLIPQENQKLLTEVDRFAAVVVGTQRCHLLAIETV